MNTEFERNQITRKGVFVKSKRSAPQPPKRDSSNEQVNRFKTEIGQEKLKNNFKDTSRAYPTYSGNSITNSPFQTSGIKITEAAEEKSLENNPNKFIEDDVSLAMLDRIEKQINRLEFDTKVAPKEVKTTNIQMFKKPIQYTGLESLLNTGVSNVATEHGIGYFEKDPDEVAHDTDNNFIRNANVRQSLGGHGNLVPPPSRPSRPVVRTASDTDQMKELIISKQALKRKENELINSPTVNKLLNVRDQKHLVQDNTKSGVDKEHTSQMPTDVRKYVEAKMASKVMVM